MVFREWEVANRALLAAWCLCLIGKSDIDQPLYAHLFVSEANRTDQQQ